MHPTVGSKRSLSVADQEDPPDMDHDPNNAIVELIRQHPVFQARRDPIMNSYAFCEAFTPAILPDGDAVCSGVISLFQLVDTPLFRVQLLARQGGAGPLVVLPVCMRAHVLFILTHDLGMPGWMGHLLYSCHAPISQSQSNVLLPFVQMTQAVSGTRPTHPGIVARTPGPSEDTFLPTVDFGVPGIWRMFTPVERLVYAIIAMDAGYCSKYGHDFCAVPHKSQRVTTRTHESLGAVLREHPLTAALYASSTLTSVLESLVRQGRVEALCLDPAVRDPVGKMYTPSVRCQSVLNVLFNEEWAKAIYLLSRYSRDALGMPCATLQFVPPSVDRDEYLRTTRQTYLVRQALFLLGDLTLSDMLRIFTGDDPSCDVDFFSVTMDIDSEVTSDLYFYPLLTITKVIARDFDAGLLLECIPSTFYRCKIPEVISEELIGQYLLFLRDHRGAQLSLGGVCSLAFEMWVALKDDHPVLV